MSRRSRLPLVLAAGLAGVAALLFAVSDGPRAQAAPAPAFPTHLRPAEYERLQQRRTLVPPVTPAARAEPDEEPPPRRDPFLVALPTDPGRSLLVLEANALRHSRLGELFVDCVFAQAGKDPLEPVRRDLGIDPLKDVDRLALAQDGVVLTGFFENARLEELSRGAEVTARGQAGRVYRAPGERSAAVGTWGSSILVFGQPDFVEASLDRLEGRTPPAPPLLPEALTYGEAYGVLTGDALRELFRGERSDLGRRLAETASRIELHADAMRDVAISAKVSGEDAGALDDLGSAIGAALAVARVQARARGEDPMAQLLEHARVERRAAGFAVELAIPVQVLESWFAGCGGVAPARR
jgi:hypothetical protein